MMKTKLLCAVAALAFTAAPAVAQEKIKIKVIGQPLDDDRIASQRQVRAMLFAGAYGDDHSRIAFEQLGDFRRAHTFDAARRRRGVDRRRLTHFN